MNGVNGKRMWLKVYFCTGSIGGLLIVFSIFLLTAHVIIGLLMLTGALWAIYKLFFYYARVFADEEAKRRRTYVELARQRMKLLDSDLATMNDSDAPGLHMDTCRCRVCR